MDSFPLYFEKWTEEWKLFLFNYYYRITIILFYHLFFLFIYLFCETMRKETGQIRNKIFSENSLLIDIIILNKYKVQEQTKR